MGNLQNESEILPEYRQPSSQAVDALFDVNYSLYVTENYSDNYAYPLIAYLHEGHRSEKDLWNWFPGISDQNYIGLGVRAPFPHPLGLPGQFDWKLRRPDASIGAVRDAVGSLQRDWLLHAERIYLFGEGAGATVALQHLILQQSLDFDSVPVAGVICRSLPEGWSDWLPHISDDLKGRILFLDPLRDAEEHAAVDAFLEAGLELTLAPALVDVSPFEAINHWMMAGIKTAVF